MSAGTATAASDQADCQTPSRVRSAGSRSAQARLRRPARCRRAASSRVIDLLGPDARGASRGRHRRGERGAGAGRARAGATVTAHSRSTALNPCQSASSAMRSPAPQHRLHGRRSARLPASRLCGQSEGKSGERQRAAAEPSRHGGASCGHRGMSPGRAEEEPDARASLRRPPAAMLATTRPPSSRARPWAPGASPRRASSLLMKPSSGGRPAMESAASTAAAVVSGITRRKAAEAPSRGCRSHGRWRRRP